MFQHFGNRLKRDLKQLVDRRLDASVVASGSVLKVRLSPSLPSREWVLMHLLVLWSRCGCNLTQTPTVRCLVWRVPLSFSRKSFPCCCVRFQDQSSSNSPNSTPPVTPKPNTMRSARAFVGATRFSAARLKDGHEAFLHRILNLQTQLKCILFMYVKLNTNNIIVCVTFLCTNSTYAWAWVHDILSSNSKKNGEN